MPGLDFKYVEKIVKAAGAGPLAFGGLGILLMFGVGIAILPKLVEQQPFSAVVFGLAVLASIAGVILFVQRASRQPQGPVAEGPVLNWTSDIARRMYVALDGYVVGSAQKQAEVWARLIQQLRLAAAGDEQLIIRLRQSVSQSLYNEIKVAKVALRKEIDAELKQADITLS